MTNQTIYFAEFCPHGATTLSYYDDLVRFESQAERDAYVAGDDMRTRALGPKDARRIWSLGGAEYASVIINGEIVPAVYAPDAPTRYAIG